jgi:methyltransferase (TIGR00027 family)
LALLRRAKRAKIIRVPAGVITRTGAGLATVSHEPKPLSDFTASRTALATSLMRAVHSRLDPNPLIDDPWGERLVPEAFRLGYRAAVLARLYPDASQMAPVGDEARAAADAMVVGNLRASPAYAGVILRTRYTEDALRVAVASGVRQYVIVGAGFDSFALRRPAFARELAIYEIDHPATQELKRRQIAECGVALGPAVHFLAADLSQATLAATLRRSSYHAATPSFFSWLGVTMYLTREANLATFAAIAQVAAPGSEIVFTYFDSRAYASTATRFSELRERVAALGEPFRSGFDPNTIGADLEACGLTLVEDLDDAQVLERIDHADSNDLRPSTFSHVALARVRA